MEHTYENVAALAGRAAGPLASYLGPFVTSLINQQYAASVIYIKITHALAFDRWVAKRRVVLADLLNAVTPLNGKPGRYRPDDKLLAFLQSLQHGLCPVHPAVRIDSEPRHSATGHSPIRDIIKPMSSWT